MFNVCPNCGEYAVEKIIDTSGPYAICPHCHHAHPFLNATFISHWWCKWNRQNNRVPFPYLHVKRMCSFEKDILWGMVKTSPTEKYSSWSNVWLRIAKNIGQSGRPVVLCGTALPEQYACGEEANTALGYTHLRLVRPQFRGSTSPVHSILLIRTTLAS